MLHVINPHVRPVHVAEGAAPDAPARLPSFRRIVAGIVAFTMLLEPFAVMAQSTVDLSNNPMAGRNPAKPNLIIGYDDSGSMDWETVIRGTRDGELWWTGSSNKPFWADATVTVTKKGTTTTAITPVLNVGGGRGTKDYGYLFPNGSTDSSTGDAKRQGDRQGSWSIAPIPQFAFARSYDYNPLYYNPATRYDPWLSAYIDGALRTFSNATPTAARSHPYFPTSGTAITFDITAKLYQASPQSDWTFRFYEGMTIPTSVPWHTDAILARKNGSGGYSTVTTAITVGNDDYYDVMIPYLPGTYWKKETCRNSEINDTVCTTAWDGNTIRRYPLDGTVTSFTKATGRTDCAGTTCTLAEERQNFANWFQYHRKRRLAMASGMGAALGTVTGIRADAIYFNAGSRPDAVMRDFSSTVNSENGKVVLGKFYSTDADSGTPIRSMLKFIGEQYARTGSGAPIQYGCQRNTAFIATDGFNTDTSTTAPSYTRSTWVNSAPYTDIIDNSLADIAGALYTNNPRSDLPTGLLSIDPTASGNNIDQNTNLHVNTYAVTLGALGTIYGTSSSSYTNPWVNPPTWPAVGTGSTPSQIDDLWHATINGRGQMFNAYNASDMTSALNAIIRSLLTAAGSDAGIAVSSYNISSGNNTAYVSSFNAQNWSGQLAAYSIDVNTGTVVTTPGTELWTARDQLNARTPSSRIIASHDGSAGVKFASGGGSGNLPTTLVNQLALTSTSADGADVLAYLRGDRTREGTTYRTRAHLLGDIVSAEPAYDNGVVYQAANDGMLHAFDASTGAELWAYVPYNVIPNLKNLASPTYSHQFFVDGTPVIQDLGTQKVLVGGLRGGGAGYYAIDITSPRINSENTLAGKVLWEFPNASSTAATRTKVGKSYGKPVLVKIADGTWVALLTSGYNNSSGGGHLHVLNATTGALIRTIDTPSGSGLGQVAAWVRNPVADPTVDYVYGGDLSGNLWRFDLRATDPATWSVVKLTTFPSTQPVTTAPELITLSNKRLIVVATGRMLGDTDLSTTATQSVYGIMDDLTATPTIADPRATGTLYKQTLTVATGGIRNVTSDAVDFGTYKGWYFDLPAGERVNTDPSVAFGTLVFTSNLPSSDACQTQSFIYAVNVETGGQLPSSMFSSTPWTGRQVGFTLASRPVLITLPNGSLVSITHKSDASVSSSAIPLSVSNRLKKYGWREIFR